VVRIIPPDAVNPIGQVQAFSDRNSDGQLSAGEPILASFYLPSWITFTAPPNLTDAASVDSFSPDPGGAALPHIAIFRSDSSILAAGAFRLGDPNDNFVEIRITSTATPIPKLRKWQGGVWVAKGENKETWEWN
jgi:hypothetical protein